MEAGPRAPEVQGAVPQPLPHLRAAARLPAQVRHVPYLLPAAGRRGTHPRRDEVELVMASTTTAAKIVKRAPAGIVSDPIADMLTRVRNANTARHPERSEERRVGKECRSRWSP